VYRQHHTAVKSRLVCVVVIMSCSVAFATLYCRCSHPPFFSLSTMTALVTHWPNLDPASALTVAKKNLASDAVTQRQRYDALSQAVLVAYSNTHRLCLPARQLCWKQVLFWAASVCVCAAVRIKSQKLLIVNWCNLVGI